MGTEIAKALKDGADKLGEGLGKGVPNVFRRFYGEAHQGINGNIERSVASDSKSAKDFSALHDGDAPKDVHASKDPGSSSGKSQSEATGKAAGDLSKDEGNVLEHDGAKKSTVAGDPVDTATGQMITGETDVELPGRLPLILHRVYASGYRGGRLFGPGWSSTLDTRIQIDADGIHFTDDDGRILHYPTPERDDAQVFPAEGARWPLTWDRRFDTVRITDPRRRISYEFTVTADTPDASEAAQAYQRPLTAITDGDGNRIDVVCDEGLPVEVRHVGGYRIKVDTVFTPAGFRVQALHLADDAAPHGSTTLVRYDYDARGRLIAVTDSADAAELYEWDEQDRISLITRRDGFAYGYEYDERGRVIAGHGPDGMLSMAMSYDDDARVTTSTNSLGHRTTYGFDAHGRPVRIEEPDGSARCYAYDRNSRLLAETNGADERAEYTLNEAGDPVRVTRPDGTATELAYNDLGLLTTLSEVNGDSWRFDYDERGNLAAYTDPTGATTRYTHTRQGHLATITDALGHTTTFESNAAGLPVAETNPLGDVTRYAYDAAGRMTLIVHPDDTEVRFAWDARGLLVSREHSNGEREVWSYNDMRNAVEYHDPLGTTARLEYGPFSTLIARTDPSGRRHRFAYDTELRPTAVTGPDGQSWRYAYDPAGNLRAQTDYAGRTIEYRRGLAGRLIGQTEGENRSIEFGYDALGHITSVRGPDVEQSFEYDQLGRLRRATNGDGVLDLTLDPLGRLLSETWNGHTVTHEYDAVGQHVRRSTPGGASTTWTYDEAGRPVALTAAEAVIAFEHDAMGRETSRRFGTHGALTQSYDEVGRLTAQAVWAYRPGETGVQDDPSQAYQLLQQRAVSYRADGVPLEITDRLRGDRRFDLDLLGRVTGVTGPARVEQYAYDALGNIARSTVGAPEVPDGTETDRERQYDGLLLRSAGRTHYEYDDAGQLVRVLRRTLSGQRHSWTYTWNSLGQLVETQTPDGTRWRYVYDPLGRRRSKQRLDEAGELVEETRFDWDETRLAEQTTNTPHGEARVLTWDYEPGNYRPATQREQIWAGTADQRTYDQRFYAIVTDLVGTPAELVAMDGRIAWHRTADLWGATITAPEAETECPLRFPGQYFDAESGLHYNLHRYYDPETGTYVCADPLGIDPKPNPRTYVGNPLTQVDPLGLTQQEDWAVQDYNIASQLHSALPTSSQGYRTTAVVSALDGSGNRVRIAATNGASLLSPGLRNDLDAAVTMVQLSGQGGTDRWQVAPSSKVKNQHAEVNALEYIHSQGWTPQGGGASRNCCDNCASYLQGEGAHLFGTVYPGNGPGQRTFAW
ncbi:DUF6531 domain-containing protein [Actinospica robiniae]|uniref:DUF6531 domain-containing protein n=1 Tax=Actinospica robiniae TaxID=304901 RepID=UPI00041A4506|nr:DUF6531 domain-containing protein [Actinospica robiniae]